MMQAEIKVLKDHAAYCRERVYRFTDIIQLLAGGGSTPGFELTFSNGHSPDVVIDIADADVTFSMGVYMEWVKYYSERLRETEARLHALQSA